MTSRTEANEQRRKRRRALAAAVTGIAVLLAWMIWLTARHTTDVSAKDAAQHSKTSAQASASAVGSVANQGKQLAKNVQQQCRTDAGFRRENPSLCVQASVLATVTPSAIPGPQGPAGRGITSVHNVGGHLVLSFTDGTAQDVGLFVGTPGKNGHNGTAGTDGRGITAQSIVGGHLVASYTDGTVADLGQVVGAAGTKGDQGVSVTDVAVDPVTHVVTVTYSNNDTPVPIGTLPAGPKGDPGDAGKNGTPGLPPGAIVIQVPGPLPMQTTTETCTPPAGATDPAAQPTAPTYTCQ